MDLNFFQHLWWFIISTLGALLVMLLFVQGGQTLLRSLAKSDQERKVLVNALGRKWELTFTTLVTFGGAFFAAFPLFYSTSFGGAYWVWILILFCFVLQAVSYEYRSKPNNLLGTKVFDGFLYVNGLLGTILLGAAVGTFFTGSEFSVVRENITNYTSALGSVVVSEWQGPAYGLEAALNPINLSLGLSLFFLARCLGALYFINTIHHEEIVQRARRVVLRSGIPFLVFFLAFLVMLFLKSGFAVDSISGLVYMEPYKYLHNFIDMPLVGLLFLFGVVLVLVGLVVPLLTKSYKGIWYAGIGVVMTVLGLFLCAGWNDTSFYPSTFDLQHSLTIANSSSSLFTLEVMSIVAMFIPFVVAYIWWAWRAMNRKKISVEEVESDDHSY